MTTEELMNRTPVSIAMYLSHDLTIIICGAESRYKLKVVKPIIEVLIRCGSLVPVREVPDKVKSVDNCDIVLPANFSETFVGESNSRRSHLMTSSFP